MPDYEACNGVTASNLEACNGVAKANIQAINGVDTPSSAASVTTLVVGCMDGLLSYAPVGDAATKQTWQDNKYDAFNTSGDFVEIAAGKDGSGNLMYVAVIMSNAPEILLDDDGDITDGDTWVSIDLGASGQPAGNFRQRTVAWGNNVWVTAGMFSGSVKNLYRSTDGSNWSAIDLTGLTDIDAAYTAVTNQKGIYALTTNGTGTWWFGFANKLYRSTDNASSWSLHHTFTAQSNAYHIKDLAYTNNSLIALFHLTTSSDDVYLSSAAASDTTDWGTEQRATGNSGTHLSTYNYNNIAAAGGRVIVNDAAQDGIILYDVNGKTLTRPAGTDGDYNDIPAGTGNLNYIIGDGNGNWWGVRDGNNNGDIIRSTDNGVTWTHIVDGFSGSKKAECICHDVPLPL